MKTLGVIISCPLFLLQCGLLWLISMYAMENNYIEEQYMRVAHMLGTLLFTRKNMMLGDTSHTL